MPHLAQLRGLAQDLGELQARYLAAADPGSVESLAQFGLQLGERLSTGEGSGTPISQLVGAAVQRTVPP